MDSFKIENKKYLRQKVNPILELLLTELMKEQPEDPVAFMKDWLEHSGRDIENRNNTRLETRPEGIETSEESDDDELYDEYDEEQEFLQIKKQQANRGMRTSVCAEVYGEYNKKEDFEPPVHPKSEDQKSRIFKKLNQNFMFSRLDESEKNIIVMAMQNKEVKEGDMVIEEGDEGNELFVIDSGTLDCTKKNKETGDSIFLKKYEPGEAFGELALLYNAPRAASIKANEDCSLFTLDRETFNHIVKDAAVKQRKKYYDFISNVDLLESLDDYEKNKICDCLQIQTYQGGNYIIHEGDSGDTFYFVVKGECIATKRNKQLQTDEKVYEFKENDYFGELALLKDEPRAASIITVVNL